MFSGGRWLVCAEDSNAFLVNMTECQIAVDRYRADLSEGVLDLIAAHMQLDMHWPPAHARELGDLDQWLDARSDVGRWVAMDRSTERLVGHVGVSTVPAGDKANIWAEHLSCTVERLVEIGRLVVHPDHRRSGVSGRLTRRCVRDVVAQGYVPVASALEQSNASQSMMINFGWQIIGDVLGKKSKQRILLLIAPRKLVDAALTVPWD